MMAAMVVAFVLALFSKEQAMTLPALATVYEHFYRKDRSETSRSDKLARYGPLWLVSGAYVLYRIQFLGTLAPRENWPQLTPQQIVLSAIALVGQYVGKLLWPVRLCFFYSFHPSTSPFDPAVLAGLLVLLALAGFSLVCWRTGEQNLRFACFGIMWFLATLAPVLNAHWLATNVFTERYLYLPSVGLAWLVGFGASKLWSLAGPGPEQRRALLLAGVAVGALCTARIVIRNRDWNNDIVLYTRTLELSPDADIILDDLASAYWSGGAMDKAESVWKRALAVNPNNVDVLNNLGVLALRQKDYPLAAGFFQRAAKLKPDESKPHLNLGETYLKMGLRDQAETQLRAAVVLSPFDYRVLNDLGRLFLDEGREGEAEEQFRASVRVKPNALAYDYLGAINGRRGTLEEAERDFRAALSMEESDSYAHFGLGDIYTLAGRRTEALSQYQAGLVEDPTNPHGLAAVQELRQQITGAAP
jgi:tetratricopeptide (TPR) repeat protein